VEQQIKNIILRLPLALSVLFMAGCATDGVSNTLEDPPALDQNYEYIIGPGDVLDIFVWGYPDFSVSIPVRPDGKITTRLIEDMQAAGSTPTKLARGIEKQYLEYVTNPVVSVTVSGFVGNAAQQIRVFGAGSEPKSIPFSNGMSVVDLMIAVGKLGEFANGNKSVLVRTIDGEEKKYRLRLHDLLNKGDTSANVTLYPGDIVIIPESWF